LEPVTAAIVTALSEGGMFVLKGVATEAVKSAYGALKARIQKQYPAADVSVAELEMEPSSKARQETVGEYLERERALTDPELVKLAQTVVVLIQQQPSDVARAIGVDLGEIEQASVTFGNVVTGKGATGVKIEKVAGGTLQFGNVTASVEPESPKKA
jgi:hypothetical protein